MIAVAQLGATQQRFAACRTNSGASAWTSSPHPCAAPRSRATARAQPRAHAAAIALLFENFTTVFVGRPAWGLRSATRTPSRRCRRSGRRRCTGLVDARRSPWISLSRNTFRDCWPRWTRSSRRRSNRWNARTCSTSTGIASSPAPTWTTVASRHGRGRTCSARCAPAPTRPAGCATGCRRGSVAATGPTSTWRSSGNTWRTRASGCTTTCRTSRRSSAISRR